MPLPNDLPPDFPERIKRLRAKLNLTQTRLGELLGVSAMTISRWESGQGQPSTVQWQRITEAEEHGIYALRYREPEVLRVAEPVVPYGASPPLDFSADPDVVRTVAEAHRLTYGHMFNPAFAAEVSLVEPLPHQRVAVYEHLLPQPRIRFLLADDPGAGKTIMSGLLIRELLLRRLVRRVLIVPPAGLVTNWKREMRTLFHLPFEIISGSDAKVGNPFTGEDSDLVIISVDTLAGKNAFARLQESGVTPYDIVFFDEAHKLSANRNNTDFTVDKTDRYKLAESLAGIPSEDSRWRLNWAPTHFLLLTATPHMGREYPYYALWRLLEPNILSSIDAFNSFSPEARKRYFIRRTKEEMVRYDGSRIYPERFSDTLGCRMSDDEASLYKLTTTYIENHYNKARILNRSAARLAMSVFQRRLTSSTYALWRSFERRIGKLKQLIEEIKSGRLSEQELESRQRKLGETVPDPLDKKTADEEDGEENEAIENRALGGVASRNLAELSAELVQVTQLAELAHRIHNDPDREDAKFQRLREVILDPRFKDEKLLIFTEHRDTLEFLVARLRSIGFADRVAYIHGGMAYGEVANLDRLSERQDHVEFFRRPASEGGATYMVCTDAAAEGINLQFCSFMVNYDIPWNPARLEQRMGRIHRFGQKRDKVFIVNLVSDPENTREGRVLKTLLDKLEAIRKELHKDKVFDVIGNLLEGKTLAQYMEEVLLQRSDEAIEEDIQRKITKQRVEENEIAEQARFGVADDLKAKLPELRQQLAREERMRLMPGYVRRFAEKAAPLVNIGTEGDLDGVFSLRARQPGALDAFFPLIEMYPPTQQNRFSIRKPRDPAKAVFFHPGEPVFDKLRTKFVSKFDREAKRGAIFVDPSATEPYSFHLALVSVARAADRSFPVLARPELLETALVGLRRRVDGNLQPNGHIETCPVEHLLLLRGLSKQTDVAAPAYNARYDTGRILSKNEAFLRDAVGEDLVRHHRTPLESSLLERENHLRRGYDYQEADLAETATKLREKARSGDSGAKADLTTIRRQQDELQTRKEEALEVLRREPDLIGVSDIEMLVHALVLPSSNPEDKRRQDAEVEQIAMAIARAHEESRGARVVDVHTPELARLESMMDYPGFDLLSLHPDGERDIEVKGRARVGEVELSENEWARAATLREKYWLYVVFDCATDWPKLHIIQDPFAKLLLRNRTSVVVAADEILRNSESGTEGIVVAEKKKPPSARHPLLQLIEQWEAEPGDYDEMVGPELDRLLAEDPIRFDEPVIDWEDDEE